MKPTTPTREEMLRWLEEICWDHDDESEYKAIRALIEKSGKEPDERPRVTMGQIKAFLETGRVYGIAPRYLRA